MKASLLALPALAAALVLGAGAAYAQANPSGTGGPGTSGSGSAGGEARQGTDDAAPRRKYAPVVYPKFMEGGERPDIEPVEPPTVYFDQAEEPGSIIIDTEAKKLYYVLPGKKAFQYPISVGREGFTWSGTEKISRIAAWPSWTPPPEMHKRIPGLPITVTGGMKNPQGARALYLGNTVYRIHGTNNDRTVGRANSSGCFRLKNEHVVHLAAIARVGTRVKVLKTYAGGVSESAPLSSLFDFWGGGDAAPAKQATKAKPKKPVAKTAAAPKPPAKQAAAE